MIDILKKNNVNPIIVVPDKNMKQLLLDLEKDKYFDLIYSTREEEGVGIYAGAYLVGKTPMMLIQNSGLGNMINAIQSLLKFYEIPFRAIIYMRGLKNEKIKAQIPMGKITYDLLRVLNFVSCFDIVSGLKHHIGHNLDYILIKREE